MTALAVGFPLDTVKVRFQNPDIALKSRSTFQTFSTILRDERIHGLYRGITSPLLTNAPLNGLVFSSYRFFLSMQLERTGATATLAQITLAGAGSGIVGSLITTPTELIKIRQQSFKTSTSDFTSAARPLRAYDVALQIARRHGVKGLYRGITATVLRDIGYGPYFGAYEATLRYWPRSDSADSSSVNVPHTWPAMLVAGGLAGIAGWVVTFPFDVIKTRVQSTYGSSPDNPYRSTLSTIMASYRAEGLSVFFRGLAPTLIRWVHSTPPCTENVIRMTITGTIHILMLIRAIPVNMVTFVTFETVVFTFS
ncbi:hypothetical protein AcW1_006356 [Taiwanofungus camphoratus]|nr:hypothetical protein AcV7_003215 [Antrodia cinnamomea]KAI0954475.1 hypothetical protein AcW1_006356 [Antrodia cinnamomea]